MLEYPQKEYKEFLRLLSDSELNDLYNIIIMYGNNGRAYGVTKIQLIKDEIQRRINEGSYE